MLLDVLYQNFLLNYTQDNDALQLLRLNSQIHHYFILHPYIIKRQVKISSQNEFLACLPVLLSSHANNGLTISKLKISIVSTPLFLILRSLILPTLKELDFSGPVNGNNLLLILKFLENHTNFLKSLTLSLIRCEKFFLLLSRFNFKKLIRLSITKCDISDSSNQIAEIVRKSSNLCTLHLYGQIRDKIFCNKLWPAINENLNLTDISLCDTDLGNRSIQYFRTVTSLTSISLERNRDVTDKLIAKISALPNLTRINLLDTNYGVKTMEAIGKNPKIFWIVVGYTTLEQTQLFCNMIQQNVGIRKLEYMELETSPIEIQRMVIDALCINCSIEIIFCRLTDVSHNVMNYAKRSNLVEELSVIVRKNRYVNLNFKRI